MTTRCVGFVDLDAFYASVEVRRNPKLVGLPVCVCQYETSNHSAPDVGPDGDRIVKGTTTAGLIAVSYPARAKGVKRGMSAVEAQKVCPDVVLVRVPTAHKKADLAIYKDAGQRVVEELKKFAGIVEKRSVDEVAIDVTDAALKLLATTTPSDVAERALACSHLAHSDESLAMAKVTHADSRRGHDAQRVRGDDPLGNDDVGQRQPTESEALLFAGAVVVDMARKHVMTTLGYSCSAGIAETKMMSKVACGLHKPNQQTICLGQASVDALLRDMPFNRLPGLGGQLGERVATALNAKTAGEIAAMDRSVIRQKFSAEETDWLLSVVSGRYAEPVKDRSTYKSFGASKTFYRKPLGTLNDVQQWLDGLAQEITARILKDRDENGRAPTNATISLTDDGKHVTRTEKISFGWVGTLKTIQQAADRLFRRWANNRRSFTITSLGLGVSNFEDLPQKSTSVLSLMQQQQPKKRPSVEPSNDQPSREDVDADVFNALPPDIQAELRATDPLFASKPTTSNGDVDQSVFDALPPEIQDELRDDRKRKQLLRGGGDTQQPRPHPPAVAQQKKFSPKKKQRQRGPAGVQRTKIDAFLPPPQKMSK